MRIGKAQPLPTILPLTDAPLGRSRSVPPDRQPPAESAQLLAFTPGVPGRHIRRDGKIQHVQRMQAIQALRHLRGVDEACAQLADGEADAGRDRQGSSERLGEALGTVAPEVPIKLRAQGLSKTYGETVALQPLDLEVRAGELLTLLGPSGSGKTTLLQIICGLVEPTTGQLLHRRRGTRRTLPAHQRDMGVVFQNYALFPHLTVERERLLPVADAQAAGARALRKKVAAALEMVDLAALRRALSARSSPAASSSASRLPAASSTSPRLHPDGRTAGCARPQAARDHADRDQAPAPRHRSDDRIRHP